MKNDTHFVQLYNEYVGFIGSGFNKSNPEELKLFFEFLKARNLMAVREGLNNNTQMLHEIKELLKTISNKK